MGDIKLFISVSSKGTGAGWGADMKQLNLCLKFLNAGFTFIEHFLAVLFPILISFSQYIVFYR